MSRSIVALIPARAGSKRILDKNVRPLGGHPLIAYTISAAINSGVFDAVIVSTDSPAYADIAQHYGAEVPGLRPAAISGDTSPDIEWIDHTLRCLADSGRYYECFSILRPTSPFRRAETIVRAWNAFSSESVVDSLRAVEKCRQHPGKMWVIGRNRLHPLLPFTVGGVPWHSSQYQALPEVYVQNASLEIARSRVVLEGGTIAGDVIMPFLTEHYEGVDVNSSYDWEYAQLLVSSGEAALEPIAHPAYQHRGEKSIT